MPKRFPVLVVVLVAIALLMEVSAFAQGCSMCRTALENSVEGKALAGSFNYAILFLMGIPYAMFGTAGIMIFRAYRKRAARKPE
jgi:hypothetical protein